MSGVGMDEASRGGRVVFWVGVAALAVAIGIGAAEAWSMRGRLPFGAQAYIEHVRALKRAGEVDEALRELEAEARINRHDVRAPMMLARLRVEYGRPGSLEALEHAARYSLDPITHLRLARAYARVTRDDEADAALEHALVLAHGRVDVWVAAAQTWEKAGREARARDAYRRALELDPRSTEARLALTRLDGAMPAAGRPR
jgi:tetratricopeptide (TPR) repeat protein